MYKQSTTGLKLCVLIAKYIELCLGALKESFAENRYLSKVRGKEDEKCLSVYVL